MSCQSTPYVLKNPSKLACIFSQYYRKEHTKSMTGSQPYHPPPPLPVPFFVERANFWSQTHNLSFFVVELAIAPRPDPCPKNLRGERGGNKGFSRVLTKSIFLNSSH